MRSKGSPSSRSARSTPVLLLTPCVELVLNGATINFVAFAHFNRAFEMEGQVFALFVIVLAAAEAAVALAIVLNFYNNHSTVDVDRADELKG